MTEYRGRREWLQHGPVDRFESLLTWRELNTLIRDHRPAPPRFRLMKGGDPIPERAYQRSFETLRGPLRLLDVARFLAQLRDGATLVWDAIDQAHGPVRSVKQALERELRAFVFVNLYASWGAIGGIGDHWDDHDVFVLQISGRKNWRVHPATHASPLPDDVFGEPPEEYAHDWTLAPGSVLYLPRGWWHRVTPVGEPSLHLTIGVLRPTNADFLEWMLNRAKASELVRADWPASMDDAARSEHATALRAVLDEWIQPWTLELYEQAQDAAHYLDPRPTLQAVAEVNPEAWDPSSKTILLSTRANLLDRGTDVALVVAGQQWLAPKDAAPLLGALIGGQSIPLGTLLEHMPRSLVSDLVTEGILAVV
jgi:ribosomal protein L16 Arg81 hydroxylase